MATYGIRVLKPFTDITTGKYLEYGDKIVTDSLGRVRNIIGRGLGELMYAHHNKSGKKIMIHQKFCYMIGGIETAHQQIAKVFADHNITFIFGKIDPTQFLELAETCDVIVDDGLSRYETDIFIMANYDSADAIISRVRADKIYQFIHADFKNLKAMPVWSGFEWRPHQRVNKVLAVSKTAQKGLKECFGVDSVIVPNVLAPIEQKRLVFVVLSRASAEKGIDRVLELVNRMNAAGKDFVVFLCSTIDQTPQPIRESILAQKKIVVVPPSPYSKELLRSADYLIQLSLNESYCYSVREALQMQVPVIVSKIPEFEKLVKNGKNGYILDDDLGNLDIDKIFNKVPKPKPYEEPIPEIWSKVLKGEL